MGDRVATEAVKYLEYLKFVLYGDYDDFRKGTFFKFFVGMRDGDRETYNYSMLQNIINVIEQKFIPMMKAFQKDPLTVELTKTVDDTVSNKIRSIILLVQRIVEGLKKFQARPAGDPADLVERMQSVAKECKDSYEGMCGWYRALYEIFAKKIDLKNIPEPPKWW